MTTIETETAERDALLAEARELTRSGDDLTGPDAARFAEIETEVERLNGNIRRRQALIDGVDPATGKPAIRERVEERNLDDGAPMQLRHVAPDRTPTGWESATELRSIARATIERGAAWRYTSDDNKHAAMRTVETSDPGVARHIATFGTEDYRRAFAAYMAGPDAFAATASDREREALRRGFEETRATLQTSGAVLPSPLDPTVHISNAGVEGSLLEYVSRRTTSSSTWRGITSAGITASYDAELAEVSDDTPALTGTTITTRKAQAMAVVSLEVLADQPDIGDEVSRLLADAKLRLDEQVAWNGAAGSNQPIGMWTAIDGGSYEVSPTTSEAFGMVDIYKLPEAVNARARDRGRFGLELSTYHYIFQQLAPGSTSEANVLADGQLIGRPYSIHSVIDAYSDIDTGATADNPILVFGDFGAYFWVDRVGMSVYPPQLLQNSGNMRFDGTAGIYAFWRSGGDVLIDGDLAVLNIATTA
jgi:HK97 family phage major capsid protein